MRFLNLLTLNLAFPITKGENVKTVKTAKTVYVLSDTILNNDCNFYPIHLGHCICESQRKYYLKNVSSSDACEYFLAEGKEQLKTTIEKSLRNMWISLDQYLQTINLKEL